MSTRTSKVSADIKETSGRDLQQNVLRKAFLLQFGFGDFFLGGWLYRKNSSGRHTDLCVCVAENSELNVISRVEQTLLQKLKFLINTFLCYHKLGFFKEATGFHASR